MQEMLVNRDCSQGTRERVPVRYPGRVTWVYRLHGDMV